MSIMVFPSKESKILRALHILWGVISIVAALGGGAILIFYYAVKPEAMLPVWQLGLALMLYGIANTVLLIGITILLKRGE